MKKLFIAVFVLSLATLPATTRAGFFDFFKGSQAAQAKSAMSADNLILQVQKALTSQGFYKGDISGVVGSKTKTAIKSFQKLNKLPVTGLLDKTTVDMILKSGGGGQVAYPSRICNQNTAPWIRVTSPNGGETYQVGQDITVTWTSCNIPASELLEVNVNGSGVAMGFLAPNGTPNDGSETITQNWPVGSYRITVGTPATPGGFNSSVLGIYDQSNNDFFIVAGQGVCNAANVALDLLPTTPSGVQNNLNDFPVLEFKITNSTNCTVRLNGLRLAYMTTDTLPYFEDVTLREKDTMMNVWPSDEIDIQVGEFLEISDNGTAYIIEPNSSQEFVLVLESYIQQTQTPGLTYAEYSNKNMIFGFPRLNPLDTDFLNPEDAFNISLSSDVWGKVVKLPPSAF